MLTREEFDKVLEQQAEDLKAHVEEYIDSKIGEGSDEDTRRVFPLASSSTRLGYCYIR